MSKLVAWLMIISAMIVQLFISYLIMASMMLFATTVSGRRFDFKVSIVAWIVFLITFNVVERIEGEK